MARETNAIIHSGGILGNGGHGDLLCRSGHLWPYFHGVDMSYCRTKTLETIKNKHGKRVMWDVNGVFQEVSKRWINYHIRKNYDKNDRFKVSETLLAIHIEKAPRLG